MELLNVVTGVKSDFLALIDQKNNLCITWYSKAVFKSWVCCTRGILSAHCFGVVQFSVHWKIQVSVAKEHHDSSY